MPTSMPHKKREIQRKGFFHGLARYQIIHYLVSRLGIYPLANALLECFPVIRKLPSNKGLIKINSVAGWVLMEEMFSGQGYLKAISGHDIRTFIDLGCNIGWLPCLLYELQGRKEIYGLMFDADPRVIPHARWHLDANDFTKCEVIHGVVGVPDQGSDATFFINPASTQSSAKPFGKSHPFPIKGVIQEVRVPTFAIQSEWEKRYGTTLVDLLKIDIEGSEFDLLRGEINFIKKSVKVIVCEWHNWHVSLQEIEQFLMLHGFSQASETESDGNGGLLVFVNQNLHMAKNP